MKRRELSGKCNRKKEVRNRRYRCRIRTHKFRKRVKHLEDDRAGLLKILKGNEKRVKEALMEYGEMNQADLSARTGIPKSSLSRILQDLEDRSLVFRYDYGMSKMVKLA
ncbi:hypothetical protein DRN97_06635 [Methanosarcinales archaeon]|nr:MAG: hypothetical protein DRN97_06635 [Methanosarcinales archaeon]